MGGGGGETGGLEERVRRRQREEKDTRHCPTVRSLLSKENSEGVLQGVNSLHPLDPRLSRIFGTYFSRLS